MYDVCGFKIRKASHCSQSPKSVSFHTYLRLTNSCCERHIVARAMSSMTEAKDSTQRIVTKSLLRVGKNDSGDVCVLKQDDTETRCVAELVEIDLDSRVSKLVSETCRVHQKDYEVRPKVCVYGKECRQNRDVLFLSNESAGYMYSRQVARSRAPLSCGVDLLRLVNDAFEAEFNGILLNRYGYGEDRTKDYISAHSDDERGLDSKVGVVAVTHLSAPDAQPRTFRVRCKKTKKILIDVPTRHHKALIMRGEGFQKLLTHEVPAMPKNSSWRVSLTFRKHDAEAEKRLFNSKNIDWYLPNADSPMGGKRKREEENV